MADEEVRMTLRLPARLRDRLSRATEGSQRSMNAEIVARLDQSFAGSGLPDGATLEEILEHQIRQAQAALEFVTADREKP